MRNAGLPGTYAGLVLAYVAITVPLGIWVMRGFLLGIPVVIVFVLLRKHLMPGTTAGAVKG